MFGCLRLAQRLPGFWARPVLFKKQLALFKIAAQTSSAWFHFHARTTYGEDCLLCRRWQTSDVKRCWSRGFAFLAVSGQLGAPRFCHRVQIAYRRGSGPATRSTTWGRWSFSLWAEVPSAMPEYRFKEELCPHRFLASQSWSLEGARAALPWLRPSSPQDCAYAHSVVSSYRTWLAQLVGS